MHQGIVGKMLTNYSNPIKYTFLISDTELIINKFINNPITLRWIGEVQCICGKRFSKFYRQNFCYQCYWNAPEASQSIFKPELCTADLGIEERDLEWETKFQLRPHYVYLANSSGLKVGITSKHNELTRWMDQGAVQGILIAEVPNRRLAGLIEVELKKVISDRTNFRKMLSGPPVQLDMVREKLNCLNYIPDNLQKFIIPDNTITQIEYPVLLYPKKVNSVNFKKSNTIQGSLLGMKGQYLLLDQDRVFNVRAHQGYILELLI